MSISGTAPTVTPVIIRPLASMNRTDPGCCRFAASTATATRPLRTATLFAEAPYLSGMRTRLIKPGFVGSAMSRISMARRVPVYYKQPARARVVCGDFGGSAIEHTCGVAP